MNKLLLFSGGLDSVYAAWKILSEGERLYLHHVRIINDREKMAEPQYRAVRNVITQFIERGYDFAYSQSTFNFTRFKTIGFDSDIYLPIALKVARNMPGLVQVMTGMRQPNGHEDEGQNELIRDRRHRKVTDNLWKALVECADGDRFRISPELDYPIRQISKLEMLREIPEQIADLTWTCRMPVNDKPCRMCHSCRDMIANRAEYEKEKGN